MKRLRPLAAVILTELGTLVLRADGEWMFNSIPPTTPTTSPDFRFGSHSFGTGEYVSIHEHDGRERTFRVASCVPLPFAD